MNESVLWFDSWNEMIHSTVLAIGYIATIAIFFSSDYRPSRSRTVVATYILAALILYLMAFTPLGAGTGNDRDNYASFFYGLQNHGLTFATYSIEIGFVYLTWILGHFMDAQGYFFTISLIYIANYIFAIRRMALGSSLWLLVSVVVSMGFISYNVNTMRAGLALSVLVAGLSLYPIRWKMLLMMVIASSIHTSAAIPSLMMALSYLKDKTKIYYYLWFAAVVISFAAGSYFNELFTGLSDDGRTSYLTTDGGDRYNTGFRIDFIVYSLAPIAIGAYYIFKRKLHDTFYNLIYNTFILSNIFWVLVIRANFSDRFAYLSWFLIPFVLLYPLVRYDSVVKYQNQWIAAILLVQTLFITIL